MGQENKCKHSVRQLWLKLPLMGSGSNVVLWLSLFCYNHSFYSSLVLLLIACFSCSLIITFCVSDEKIALLGAIQSLFEGSMYTWVFLWTPALSPNDEEIPHGFIFATFMLASMLGSSLASKLLARSSIRVESYMQIVFVVASASLLIPILASVCYSSNSNILPYLLALWFTSRIILQYVDLVIVEQFLIPPPKVKGESLSFAQCIQILGFCTFEACVGIFWPSIMKMRSQYIPEEARSTIMNFFRIPLNIFVCVVLYNVCYLIYDQDTLLNLKNLVFLWM